MRRLTLVLVLALLPVSAVGQNMERQERCASRARAYFDEVRAESLANFKRAGVRPNVEVTIEDEDYESHFSVKLGKCLVLWRNTHRWQVEGGYSESKCAQLADAIERRVYGGTCAFTYGGAKSYEDCVFRLNGTKEYKCKGRDEFDALAWRAMNE